jgi:symplekin
LAPRIEQHILRLQQVRKDIVEGAGLKRPAIDEPTDGLDQHKRQRIGADVPQKFEAPPLPAGPISVAQLFTLTEDPGAQNLNVRAIPADMAARTLVHLLKFNVGKDQLNHAVNVSPFHIYQVGKSLEIGANVRIRLYEGDI